MSVHDCPDPRAGDDAAWERWCEATETPPWEEPPESEPLDPETFSQPPDALSDPSAMAREACDLLLMALFELRSETGRRDLGPAFEAVHHIQRALGAK